jgi:hypothetical protein
MKRARAITPTEEAIIKAAKVLIVAYIAGTERIGPRGSKLWDAILADNLAKAKARSGRTR